MQPFSIQCTTCRRGLRVTTPEAIGQILACPKCGSMVLVEAPEGWTPSEDSSQAGATPSGTPELLSSSTFVPPRPQRDSTGAPSDPRQSAGQSRSHTPPSATPPSATPTSSAPRPDGKLARSSGSSKTAWKDPPNNNAATQGNPGQRGATQRESVDRKSAATGAPAANDPKRNEKVALAAAPLAAPIAAPPDTPTPVPTPPSPEPSEVAAEAVAKEAWPKWFLPGVGATLALSALILVARLVLQGGEDPDQIAPEQIAAVPSDAATSPLPGEPSDASSNIADETQPEPSLDSITSDTANSETASETPTVDSANSAPDDDVRSTAATTETDTDTDSDTGAEPSENIAAQPAIGENTPPSDAPAVDAPDAARPGASEVPPNHEPRIAATSSGNTRPDVSSLNETLSKAPPAATGDRGAKDDEPAKPSMQRVAPRQVNLEERLADTVQAFEASGMPLHRFAELFEELSTIPTSLDLDALAQLGRSPTTPVHVRVENATAANLLESALEPLGLGYSLDRGLIVVGHPEPETARQISYTVADITAGAAGGDEALMTLMRRLIAPHSWQAAGGKAKIAASGGKIVVEQTPAVHYRLLVFCERLRVARGLPIKSRYDPAMFALTTREAKAKRLTQQTITANFSAPQPLAGVLDWLQGATGATILVDHAALAEAETSAESHCAAVAVNKPLATLLDELLEPMQLTWRVVDAGTLEITTPAAAAERDEIEFYKVPKLAADAAAGKALADRIVAELGPQAASGELGVVVHFDEASKTLIVRAPQRMQAKVEQLLAGHRG